MNNINDRFGREIRFLRIDIRNIWANALEGSPEMLAKRIRLNLSDALSEDYGKHRPIQICDDGNPTFPDYRIFADLKSRSPVVMGSEISDFCYSQMGICFFTNSVNSLDEVGERLGCIVEWEKYAENVKFDDL